MKQRNKQLYPRKRGRIQQRNTTGDRAKSYRRWASRYEIFCGILYILRTGSPWRDLPPSYGYWHAVYDRFNRDSERGLRAKVLLALQEKEVTFNEVVIDSTTMKLPRRFRKVPERRQNAYHPARRRDQGFIRNGV